MTHYLQYFAQQFPFQGYMVTIILVIKITSKTMVVCFFQQVYVKQNN